MLSSFFQNENPSSDIPKISSRAHQSLGRVTTLETSELLERIFLEKVNNRAIFGWSFKMSVCLRRVASSIGFIVIGKWIH